jgi:hypothetical protein
MKLISSAVLTLSLSVAVAAAPSQAKAPTVSGVYSPAYDQDYFLGLPYAQSPVGNLRFKQAQPLNSTWKGIRDAKKYEKHCVGYGVGHAYPIYVMKLNLLA